MTDQPTDHRAAAEAFLESANEIFSDPNKDADHTEDRLDAVTEALIGIGHALLALVGTLPGTFTIRPGLTTALTTSSNPATPAESQRCNARHDGLRCVFWSGHKDPHRAIWRDE